MNATLDAIFLPTGSLLFSEGDSGDRAYLISSGEIEIFVQRDGRELTLAHRGSGEIIGEMALLDRNPRSASARVVRSAEVVAITQRQFEQRIADTDPILRMCLGMVIARYRETLAMAQGGFTAPSPALQQRPLAPDFDDALAALTLEREIERALDRDEFELFLQPIVRLSDRGLAGFEALIRWNHPSHGLLPPSRFIPVAESSGLVTRITAHMLREAVRAVPMLVDLRQPRCRGDDEPFFVSVNVTGHDLLQPGFADTVMDILRQGALAPEHLKLEITESMLMKDPARAGRILETCRAHGMGIAVDDFGTGYSSLSHLSTLPITTLKIDRCFVQAMVEHATSRKIVNTIRHLARELEIPVVAEGIEREAEAAALTAIGCEYGQGYLFGRPMPLTEALAFLKPKSPAEPRPDTGDRRALRPSLTATGPCLL